MKGRLLLGICAWLAAGAAHADESWRFQVTPYIWGPGLGGDVQPISRLPPVHFDRSLGEILDNLDAAFFMNVTARKDRFVFFGDFTYANLTEDHSFTIPSIHVGGITIPSVHVPVDVKISQSSMTVAGGYSVIDQPQFVLDLLGGARLWHVEAEIDIPVHIPHFPHLPTSASETRTWVDPIIGARARLQLTPDWSLIGYADVGGFGAGSDTTWQAVGTINYRVTDKFFVSAGYRHMAFDYDKDGLNLDVEMGGPLVGVTVRF